MKPYGSPNNANVLTIDIPPQWDNTKAEGSVAPNIWARTGCRFDISQDIAQCETGGCGGKYDCSKAKLGPPGGTTIAEWNFYEPESAGTPPIKYFRDSFDISAVNGVSTNMDLQEVGGSPQDPFDAQPNHHTLNWLAQVYPLTAHGEDLRADASCPPAFRLTRSQLTGNGKFGSTYGFVILGDNGQPIGGDSTVSCFSNCGKYKFPVEPAQFCDPASGPICLNYQTFCAPSDKRYGQPCKDDADCQALGGVHASCWDQHNPKSPIDHTCQLRAFNANPDCPPDICTFPYGNVNPYTDMPDYSTQPPFGLCDVVDPVNTNQFCIGDDTVHSVFHRAYTWPNDAQVYIDDAPLYRVIISPGGNPVPITPVADIPLCSSLPTVYNYSFWREGVNPSCGQNAFPNTQFAIARPSPLPWSCDLLGGAGNDGVICAWFSKTPRPN
jgi:hypothetical protein